MATISQNVLAEWRDNNAALEERYVIVPDVKSIGLDPGEYKLLARTTNVGDRKFQMLEYRHKGESTPFTFFIRGDIKIDSKLPVKVTKFKAKADFTAPN